MKLIVLMALLIGSYRAFSQGESGLIQKGNSLFELKSYLEAADYYRRAIERNDKSEVARFNLGAAIYRQGKYRDAESQFLDLIGRTKEKSILSAAYYNYGNAALSQKKYAESIEAYKSALRLNPKDEDARYNLTYAKKLLAAENKRKQEEEQKISQSPQEQSSINDKSDKKDKKGSVGSGGQLNKENAERMLNALRNEEKQSLQKFNRRGNPRARKAKNW